jgi:thiol-disulfide isomerase/thioredoxin
MRKTFSLLLLAVVAASAAAQSGRRVAPPPQTEAPVEAPAVTQPEPMPAPRAANEEFRSLPESILNRRIQSLDKGSFRLADFGGKVVVVNLWATWCGPCRSEIPEYERVRRDYAARGVEFIGLTTEDPQTSSERVRQFARDLKFGFRLGWADRETAIALMNGRSVIPQTYVIAADGQVVRHWRGYASNGRNGAMLREAIDRALAAHGTSEMH